MSAETSQATSTREALGLLPLPDLDGLSEAQVRGKACVWDGVILSEKTAVDLGPRRKKHLGSSYQWFPRACRPCVQHAALAELHDHAPRCEQCVDDASGCDTGLTLRRLMREYR